MTTRALYYLAASVGFISAALAFAAWQCTRETVPLLFGFSMATVAVLLCLSAAGKEE